MKKYGPMSPLFVASQSKLCAHFVHCIAISVVSSTLYYLFLLNSKRGDEIFVLAERAGGIFETDEIYEKHRSTDRA